MKKLFIVIMLLVAVGFAVGSLAMGGNAPDRVEYVEIKTGPLRMSVRTTGPLQPLKVLPVGSEVSGTVEEMAVDFNDVVKKGQIMARLRPELFESEVARADAAYQNAIGLQKKAALLLSNSRETLPMQTEMARDAVGIAQAEFDAAEYNWNRLEELYAKKNAPELEWRVGKSRYLASKGALAQAKNQLRQAEINEISLVMQAEADVDISNAGVAQAKASLDLAQSNLERSVIRAPIDGVVLQKLVNEGEQVVSAFTAQPVIVITPDLRKMQVFANVGEADIGHVRVGQPVEFTVDACGDRLFDGTVSQVRNNPITIQGVVTYQVLIDVDNSEGLLRPEMTANVSIHVVQRESAIKISNSALRFTNPELDNREFKQLRMSLKWPERPEPPRGTTETERANASVNPAQGLLWAYDAESGELQPVPVWIGISDNDETEVLSPLPQKPFVRRFVPGKRSTIGSLKNALEQANPNNRRL